MENLLLSLHIPDTHRPYHSKRAYNLCLEVASYFGVDDIILYGDYADFYAIHQHGNKHPRLPSLLEKEIESVNDGLDELELLFPDASKTYIEGNHEFRLERFLVNQAPALYGIINCKTLFNIKERGWKWVPYGPDQKVRVLNSHLYARHEALGTSTKVTAAKGMCSICYGHIHRIEEGHMVGLDGKEHVVFSCGWLGNKKLKVYNYVKTHHQWQLGFALVYVDPKTKNFYHQIVHIKEDYTCMVNGKRFKG